MADSEPAIQASTTAVKLARQEGTVVTGKPRYDSKSKGLWRKRTIWCTDDADEETLPNDTKSELTSCAIERGALWLESHSIYHPGRWVDTVQKTARKRVRRRDR